MINPVDEQRTPMKRTLKFLGLMACGLLVAGIAAFAVSGLIGSPAAAKVSAGLGGRSALGIDYVSFGTGLAAGLIMAELARLSWSDMPRRAIAWVISNRRNAKYCAYAGIWIAVLIFV